MFPKDILYNQGWEILFCNEFDRTKFIIAIELTVIIFMAWGDKEGENCYPINTKTQHKLLANGEEVVDKCFWEERVFKVTIFKNDIEHYSVILTVGLHFV
jgi:hypothetical protein